jgi:hypothetical protein
MVMDTKLAYLLGQALAIKHAYDLPTIEKDDILLGGKYKNVPMKVTGKKKDENNQPILETTKGDRHAYGFRLQKLMPKTN